MSSATAFIVWCQYIGPTIFLTVFNTIFDTGLRAQLIEQAPNADAEAIILAGATGFRGLARPEDIPGILVAYSNSLDRVFYLVAAAGVAAWLSAWGMGWKDIRKSGENSTGQPADVAAKPGHDNWTSDKSSQA